MELISNKRKDGAVLYCRV